MPNVLIVDDHPQNRYLLRYLLTANGYEVVEATNGQEALELARKQPVSVVISDILMPVLDGFALCRAWHTDPALRAIPFVFYTSTYADPRDETFARSLGADDFILKPIEPKTLIARLQTVLQTPRDTTNLPLTPQLETEEPYLKRYNEVLVRKLEAKVGELEATNRALRIKDFALASSKNGIVLLDSSANVTYANPAMAQLCKLPLGELAGKSISELLTLPEHWNDYLTRSEGGYNFESQIRRTTTSSLPPTWVTVTAHHVLSENQQRIGVMLACRDVTEERTLRDRLARAQRLEALSLFSAGVAHDFNNLLVAMFAGLEFAGAPGFSDAEREEYRQTGLAALQRAKDLTGQLLSFAKGSVGKKQPVDLVRTLQESLHLSLSGSGIRSLTQFNAEMAIVEGNAGQLAQLFSNLLINARQAMNDQGTLHVFLEPASPSPETAPTNATKSEWIVRIVDHGPGISPDDLPRIFDPFFTTKPTGTGLGLANALAIVQDHGGRIEVSSPVGQGTTVEVSLPVSRQTAVTAVTQTNQEPARGTGHILVMDEQVIIQALMQRGLERVGYNVTSVSNGEQALLEFDRARDAGAPFDLVILDVTVRGALGGLETLLSLRRQGYTGPVIASTGFTDQESLAQLLKLGFDRVLGKPFYLHELFSLVKAVLTEEPQLAQTPPTIRSESL